jgi:hypothetical protein
MSTAEYFYPPILERRRRDAGTDAADNKEDAIALRGHVGGSLFF